jgi:hypothetical protein
MGLHLICEWIQSKKIEFFCHNFYKLTQMCESFSVAFAVVVTKKLGRHAEEQK